MDGVWPMSRSKPISKFANVRKEERSDREGDIAKCVFGKFGVKIAALISRTIKIALNEEWTRIKVGRPSKLRSGRRLSEKSRASRVGCEHELEANRTKK